MNLYIDPGTHDLVIKDSEIQTVSGAEDIAQAVRVTLQAWLGEWELDTRHGTDYARIIDDNGVTDQEIKDIISAAIYQEPQVKTINSLAVSHIGRTVSVAFTAQLQDGTTITAEVSNNG